MSELMTK